MFFIVRFTLNRIIQIREKNRLKEQAAQKKPSSKEEKSQSIVRCAECGIHLPQSEAYYDGKDTFCSEGHMQLFQENARNTHPPSTQDDTNETEIKTPKDQQKTGHSDDWIPVFKSRFM